MRDIWRRRLSPEKQTLCFFLWNLWGTCVVFATFNQFYPIWCSLLVSCHLGWRTLVLKCNKNTHDWLLVSLWRWAVHLFWSTQARSLLLHSRPATGERSCCCSDVPSKLFTWMCWSIHRHPKKLNLEHVRKIICMHTFLTWYANCRQKSWNSQIQQGGNAFLQCSMEYMRILMIRAHYDEKYMCIMMIHAHWDTCAVWWYIAAPPLMVPPSRKDKSRRLVLLWGQQGQVHCPYCPLLVSILASQHLHLIELE